MAKHSLAQISQSKSLATSSGQKERIAVTGTVARTDNNSAAPVFLGTCPPNMTFDGSKAEGVASDAQTTAVLHIFHVAKGAAITASPVTVESFNAKSPGNGTPTNGSNAGARDLYGYYTETGNASTTGGPWDYTLTGDIPQEQTSVDQGQVINSMLAELDSRFEGFGDAVATRILA